MAQLIAMPSFLGGPNRSKYTLERLKCLYSDLLYSVDISREELGRRGSLEDQWEEIDSVGDETTTSTDNPLLSLHGLRKTLSILPFTRRHRRRTSPFTRPNSRKGQELAAAFRFLAATRSPDKEGDNGGAAALRDDESVMALSAAKRIERTVVDIIREMGEVVVNGGKTTVHTTTTTTGNNGSTKSGSLTCDPCFEYFCEKNMLSLLVDIAKQNPDSQSSKAASAQHGVVWSPLVKAQVMQTVSLLVASGGRNPHTLFYILSQNAINDLIACMLPLHQWTDPALEKLVPPFVDMLKNLGLQLAGTPDLFPFYTRQDTFPLFHAALEIGTSAYAQTDSFVHINCLSIIVNTMKISTPTVQAWVSSAIPELRRLSNHFCQLFLNRYYRIADLTTGQVVDALRCSAVEAQILGLHDQISVLNDVFSCGTPGLNVRLCELLMRRLVSVILKNLEPPMERAFISVGLCDLDVIPQRECLAQVSCLFLAQLFHRVDYLPFLRMLAVALFHPKSTPLLVNHCDRKGKVAFGPVNEEDYVFVPALDAIAQGKGAKSDKFVDNPFRRSLLQTLRGDFGEWRFPVAAIVVESVLESQAFDMETLRILQIVPRPGDKDEQDDDGATEKEEKNDTVEDWAQYHATEVEEALAYFLTQMPKAMLSSVSKIALECAGSVSMLLLRKCTMSVTNHGAAVGTYKPASTPLWQALFQAKASFCRQALESQRCLGVADIFLELAEFAVCNRYKKVASAPTDGLTFGSQAPVTYACHLSQMGCPVLAESAELLVRKFRFVNFTDVEEARFQIEMAIHLRALCKTLLAFATKLDNHRATYQARGDNQGTASSTRHLTMDTVEIADEFALTFGGLGDKPDVRMDLDLRGRMTFPCFLSTASVASSDSAKLVLVVDPTDFYIVQERGATLGSIVCRVGLQKVIAAASDAQWLHLAVRHQDVGRLIKNGNMILQFENAGTCLIVREYLDRSRNTVRREMMERFRTLIEPDAAFEAEPTSHQQLSCEGAALPVPIRDDGTAAPAP